MDDKKAGGTPPWVTVVVALIGAVVSITVALIANGRGVSTGQQQAFATAVQQQASAVAAAPTSDPITQVAVTQIVITQIAVTQVAITQIAVTEVAANSAPTIVTVTPTPAPPADGDTPIGTVLAAGQAWSQQGLVMSVGKPEFKDLTCTANIPDWGTWSVALTNNTDQDLIVNLDENDFFLEDDKGNEAGYYMQYTERGCGWVTGTAAGHVDTQTIKSHETVKITAYGLGAIGDRQSYTFGVHDAGRIKNAKWTFIVPR